MRKLKLDELGRKTLEEYRQSEKHSIVVVLDNIRSAMNVGAFFRTADAFAIQKLILCGITARPPHKEIHKTAIGADHSVEWEYIEDVSMALQSLQKAGYVLAGIEQTDGSTPLDRFQPEPEKKYVLIFGNEVSGISDAILPLLDIVLEIPQFGTKHSLNVAVSGGVVLWHFLQVKLCVS